LEKIQVGIFCRPESVDRYSTLTLFSNLQVSKHRMFCTFIVQCVPIILIRSFLIPAIISFCWWRH